MVGRGVRMCSARESLRRAIARLVTRRSRQDSGARSRALEWAHSERGHLDRLSVRLAGESSRHGSIRALSTVGKESREQAVSPCALGAVLSASPDRLAGRRTGRPDGWNRADHQVGLLAVKTARRQSQRLLDDGWRTEGTGANLARCSLTNRSSRSSQLPDIRGCG